jgi:5-methylcytosine-specific restriction endonuclease McrA
MTPQEKYRLLHPNRVLEIARKSKAKNQFKNGMYAHLMRLAFPVKRLQAIARSKRHYETHKLDQEWLDRRSEYQKSWRALNLDKHCANEAKRRALKRNLDIIYEQGIKKIYNRCKQLRQEGHEVEVDHVIPLSKGGEHTVDNLQIILSTDNRSKHTSLDYIPSVVFT